MIFVDFYEYYISDLSKIELVVSKEENTIMNMKEFTENINNDDGEDINNLNPKDNDDDNFLIDCIGMQWHVFISESNKDLIKYKG